MTHRRPRDAEYDRPAGATAMQLVHLVCPTATQGHTLGLVITDDTGRVRLVPYRDPAGNRIRRDGDHLVYTCHACRRAGLGTVSGSIPLANVLDLSAALAWAWPDDPRAPALQRERPLRQEATTPPTTRDLHRAVRQQLNRTDDHRDKRRPFRDLLVKVAAEPTRIPGVSTRPEWY